MIIKKENQFKLGDYHKAKTHRSVRPKRTQPRDYKIVKDTSDAY